MTDDPRPDPQSRDRARHPSRAVIDQDPVDRYDLDDDRWGTHPSPARRVSRLAVPERPNRFGDRPSRRDEDHGRDDRYDRPARRHYGDDQGYDRREGVHVQVNNGGQHYRPWREELLLSGFRTVGNLLAWPFRLVGGLVGTAMRIMLIGVVAPAMFFGAVTFYMDHRNAPATETAHAVGKSGVGIVGSAFRGLWDGIVGNDDPKPAHDAASDADAAPTADRNPGRGGRAKHDR